jgi:hypothetical protein
MKRHLMKRSLLARVKAWVLASRAGRRAALRASAQRLPVPSSKILSEIFAAPAATGEPPFGARKET